MLDIPTSDKHEACQSTDAQLQRADGVSSANLSMHRGSTKPVQCSAKRCENATQRKRERPCHHELVGTLREALHSPHSACAAKAGKVVWPAGCDKTSVLVGRRVLHGAFHALTRLADCRAARKLFGDTDIP